MKKRTTASVPDEARRDTGWLFTLYPYVIGARCARHRGARSNTQVRVDRLKNDRRITLRVDNISNSSDKKIRLKGERNSHWPLSEVRIAAPHKFQKSKTYE